MNTKHFTFVILSLLLLSSQANAGWSGCYTDNDGYITHCLPGFEPGESSEIQNYNCEAMLPEGTVSMAIKTEEEGPKLVNIEYHNTAMNQIFAGTLNVTGFSKQPHYLVAFGGLQAQDGEDIPVSIQGSLTPNKNDQLVLSMYANRDHRIEYGYGNHLVCTKES